MSAASRPVSVILTSRVSIVTSPLPPGAMAVLRGAAVCLRRSKSPPCGPPLAAFGGVLTYFVHPSQEDPEITIRTAMVTTYLPGASPRRMEDLVTDRLEESIRQMPEIDFVSSTSKTGVSLIFVNIHERYTQMRPIWDSLRRKVDGVRGDMPSGTRITTPGSSASATLPERPSTGMPWWARCVPSTESMKSGRFTAVFLRPSAHPTSTT